MILHDASLTHLMMTELTKLSENVLVRRLSRLYGPQGANVAVELGADPGNWPWRPENVENYPLLGPVLESATAVITHSTFAANRVRREYAGDVWSIPLPMLPLRSIDTSEGPTLSDLDDRPIVLQAGAVNRTKCVPTVIDAFSMAGISDRVS